MSIKTASLGAASLLAAAVLAGPALADGMPSRGRIADGSYAAPTPNWSGLYVGAAVGYGIADFELVRNGVTNFDTSLEGAQGVVAVGYDFQLSPKWVLGLVADYAFGKLDGVFAPSSPVAIDNQWAIGARLGLLSTPSTLWHVSAGYTAADFTFEAFGIAENLPGVFVGLGFEQAFSRNLSLKLDYRFSNYGDVAIPEDDKFEIDVHSVRLGLNYRFGN